MCRSAQSKAEQSKANKKTTSLANPHPSPKKRKKERKMLAASRDGLADGAAARQARHIPHGMFTPLSKLWRLPSPSRLPLRASSRSPTTQSLPNAHTLPSILCVSNRHPHRHPVDHFYFVATILYFHVPLFSFFFSLSDLFQSSSSSIFHVPRPLACVRQHALIP